MAKKATKKSVSKSSTGTKVEKKAMCKPMKCGDCSPSGVYCLGFIGAAVYNVTVATGFWMSVLGVIKAIVWPAFLIYKLMQFIGM